MSSLSRLLIFSLLIWATAFGVIKGATPSVKCAEVRKYGATNTEFWFSELSSGTGSSFAIDGDKSTELRDDYHCAETKVEENDVIPWWSIQLGSSELVDRVSLYGGSLTDEHDYNVSVVRAPYGPDNTDSVARTEYMSYSDCHKVEVLDLYMVYDCGGKRGEIVVVQGLKNESLILCHISVNVLKFPIKNIAEVKPTSQSSLFRDAVSNLAVDGNRANDGQFYKSWSTLTPQCTHTKNEGEEHPWWTVDLLGEYLVNKVTLYNRREGLQSRLHDFEIRIGNKDIRELDDGSRRFRKNPVCASYIDSYVDRHQDFECKTPLVGRFVSIQILKKCTIPSCHDSAKEKNILTICEVEVNGISLESKIENNIRLNDELKYFIEESDTSDEDVSFPWISIYVPSPSVINRVSLVISKDVKKAPVPDFELRIGNHPITSDYTNKHFKRNILCYRMVNGKLKSGFNPLECYQPLFGRYVTLQVIEPCDNDQCLSKLHNLMEIKNIKVFGYKNVVPSRIHPTSGSNALQSSTLYNAWASLAVELKTPQLERITPKSVAYCAKTNPEEHPWLYLNMPQVLMVEEVVIYLPGHRGNYDFRNVEILVLNETASDPWTQREYLTSDMICTASENKIYQEGENRFKCKIPIKADSIAIRISNDIDSNVLNICEVEIIGCLPEEEDLDISYFD